MHAKETDQEVAEDALETLERLVAAGDLVLASVTYELTLHCVSALCDADQFERLRAVEDAINQRPVKPRR